MPLACVSKRVDAAAVPNDELVEERADTALFTFFWLLFFVNYLGAVWIVWRWVDVICILTCSESGIYVSVDVCVCGGCSKNQLNRNEISLKKCVQNFFFK